MNRDQKAAVIERVATDIQEADAIFAVDYRGISVKQAGDLRIALREAEADFTVVKNTLTERAADKAGAEHLKSLLENYATLIDEIVRAKPAAAKGRYLRTITLATTMGPGVRVDTTRTRNIVEELTGEPAADEEEAAVA